MITIEVKVQVGIGRLTIYAER